MSETVETAIPELKTMTAEEISATTRLHNYGTWRFQKTWKPMYIADAEGCYFIDGAGKRYLDLSAQLMCVNLGHKNPRVVESIAEQARELTYVAPGYATKARARLSEKLLEVLPAGLTKFFFATSGTEANEAAFKIARMYTGKTKIVSRYRSYHGSTMASIAATGDPRRWAMEPGGKGGGFIFAPETNCYDCPIKHTYPSCNIACADYIEHMIENESDVAAVILEPVVGTNGVLVPPPEYLPRIREICDRHGILLIFDEVITGFGRTGSPFAAQEFEVQPDIMTVAKGLTNGCIPMGAVLVSKAIYDAFMQGPDGIELFHGYTYSAHPAACAAGLATLDIYQREGLLTRAKTLAQHWEEAAHSLRGLPHVIDVRNYGLILGLELQSIPGKVGARAFEVYTKCFERGMLIRQTADIIALSPPLIVEPAQIDQIFTTLTEVLRAQQ